MADQHCATADEWARIERMLHHAEFSCLLELRDRIEALEAAAQPNHPEKPDSSLVERVEDAIYRSALPGTRFRDEARAAIRAVAVWMREQKHYGHAWSIRFEKEAER